MYFVFRKSDGVILYQSYTSEQAENEWTVCLRAEGGIADDYIRIVADIDIPSGYIATLNDAQDTVIPIEDPKLVARKQVKESANAKLATLGFTDEEIEALRG